MNYSYEENAAGFKIEGKTNEDIIMAGGGTINHLTKEDAWFHSPRNFPNGTLITTDVDYSQDYGDQFLLEIKGNMYDNSMPLDAKVQGYIYINGSNPLINVAGYTTCYYWKIIRALNYNGKLCFWFPSLSYWQGFDVKLTVGYGGLSQGKNRVVNVSDSVDPGGTKRVDIYLKTLATQEYVQNELADKVPIHGDAVINDIKQFVGPYTHWALNGDVVNNARGFAQSLSGRFLLGTLNDKDLTFYRNAQEKIIVGDTKTTFNHSIESVGYVSSGNVVLGDKADVLRINRQAADVMGILSESNGWAYCIAAGYKRAGSDDSYVHTGGGGHKAISDFVLKSNNDYFSNQKLNALTIGNVATTLDAELPQGGFISSYSTGGWGGSDRPNGASFGGYIKFKGYPTDINNLDFYYNNGHNGTSPRLWYRTKEAVTGVRDWIEFWSSENFNPDNYVPYTGAISNIDINSKNITTTGAMFASEFQGSIFSSSVITGAQVFNANNTNTLVFGNDVIPSVYHQSGGSHAFQCGISTIPLVMDASGVSMFGAIQVNGETVATQNYVQTKIADLVASSPSTLDTLNELAQALGNDPNFATTVATQIGTKANKSTTINAGTGLSGGGDLSTDRALSIDTGTMAKINHGETAYNYGNHANAGYLVDDGLFPKLERFQVIDENPINVAEPETKIINYIFDSSSHNGAVFIDDWWLNQHFIISNISTTYSVDFYIWNSGTSVYEFIASVAPLTTHEYVSCTDHGGHILRKYPDAAMVW